MNFVYICRGGENEELRYSLRSVNVNDAPGQPAGDTGVITYVAVCTVLVGFVSVPVIILTPLADAPPVTPPVTLGADQLYNVPSGTLS